MDEPHSFDTPRFVQDENGSRLLKWTPTPYEVILKQVSEAITNDREGKIIRALIELGWTPPEDKTDG